MREHANSPAGDGVPMGNLRLEMDTSLRDITPQELRDNATGKWDGIFVF
jgi:hypothetical protein